MLRGPDKAIRISYLISYRKYRIRKITPAPQYHVYHYMLHHVVMYVATKAKPFTPKVNLEKTRFNPCLGGKFIIGVTS